MSFGDGNLRERLEALEDDLQRAEGLVEDLACDNVALLELAGEMRRELLALGADCAGYGERLAALGATPPPAPAPLAGLPPGARVFLSGPMTGLPDWNRRAFADAAARCLELGADEVFDPAADAPRGPDPHSHGHWMRRTLHELTRWANGAGDDDSDPHWDLLLLLDGWESSSGARAELAAARACGIPAARACWVENDG